MTFDKMRIRLQSQSIEEQKQRFKRHHRTWSLIIGSTLVTTMAVIIIGILRLSNVDPEDVFPKPTGVAFYSVAFSFIAIDVCVLVLFFSNISFYKAHKLK